MYVLTSNPHKIAEYQAFGIEARLGPDMAEVMGTIDEVIIYKIRSLAPYILVEDTVLQINGEEIVDTKYKLYEIGEQENVSWITSLGYHDGARLYVYRGIIPGKLILPVIEQAASFEPCFVPHGTDSTLYALRIQQRKDPFSARRLALQAYRDGTPCFTKELGSIPPWQGKYQRSTP